MCFAGDFEGRVVGSTVSGPDKSVVGDVVIDLLVRVQSVKVFEGMGLKEVVSLGKERQSSNERDREVIDVNFLLWYSNPSLHHHPSQPSQHSCPSGEGV